MLYTRVVDCKSAPTLLCSGALTTTTGAATTSPDVSVSHKKKGKHQGQCLETVGIKVDDWVRGRRQGPLQQKAKQVALRAFWGGVSDTSSHATAQRSVCGATWVADGTCVTVLVV